MLWFKRNTHPSEADLSSLIDGELAAARRAQVEAHLQACEDCRQLLEELRRVQSLVSRLPQVEPSRSFVLSPEMAGSVAPAPPSPRRSFAFAPAAALTLLVALLVVDYGIQGGTSMDQAEDTSAPSLALQRESATDEESAAGGAALSAPEAAVAPSDAAGQSDGAAGGSGAATGDSDTKTGGDDTPAPAATPAETPGETAPSFSAATAADSGAGAETYEAEPASVPLPADVEEEGGGISLLRVLEVLSLIALALSTAYVFGPRLLRKGS